MAGDMFLMLDGIKGESADDKHKGEIDIESFSWGLAQTGSGSRGTGSGTGKVDISDISIQKRVDRSSPTLQLACANGKHIAKGKLTVLKAGENPLEYFTVDLESILVSSYQLSGADGAGIPTESLALNFVKVKTEYWTQSDKGAKGENANFSWDIAKNVKF
ncbi:MAG: Hcp family type VI secretion system effector [Steroidobacteraceae bacterium]